MAPRYPYHKYHHCGPFNRILKGPRNKVDSICRKHDIAYGKIGAKAYFKFSKADQDFINEMGKQPGARPWLYTKVFQAKKALAPELSSSSKSSDMAARTRRYHRNAGKRKAPPSPALS